MIAHEIPIDRVVLEAFDSFLSSDRSPPDSHEAGPPLNASQTPSSAMRK